MKILLYSDLHISKTSSILPLNFLSSKFSFRQNMIIETGKYLANIADEYKVDAIINLGDTFDQHTITSYDIVTASEFFKCFRYLNKPHLVLVGNHEMINHSFNAIELLSNIDNISVISQPSVTTTDYLKTLYTQHTNTTTEDNKQLAFLPYCNYTDILEFPVGDFLFSHQDIQGSNIRGLICLEDGIDKNVLKDKYKLVFNGHIHKPTIDGNVINVGSVTTHSFADDDTTVPQCYIFDTDTMNLTTFKPTICPLFRKLEVIDTDDLSKKLESLDTSYKYIISCSCPYAVKENIKTILNENDIVLNYRITARADKTDTKVAEISSEDLVQQSNVDVKKAFKDFLDIADLKFPKDLYVKVLEEVNVND